MATSHHQISFQTWYVVDTENRNITVAQLESPATPLSHPQILPQAMTVVSVAAENVVGVEAARTYSSVSVLTSSQCCITYLLIDSLLKNTVVSTSINFCEFESQRIVRIHLLLLSEVTVDHRVIPCQINTKKSLPPLICTKIGSYTVSVKTLIHSEFQCSMLYGFRVRARRKIDF